MLNQVVIYLSVAIVIAPTFVVSAKNPVILVPGDGGCQLEAQVDLNHTANFLCKDETDDYFLLWANVKYFFPIIINCFVDVIRLVRDPRTGLTSSPPGVKIRIPGWGKTSRVEWISSLKVEPFSYYHNLVDALVKHGRYERDKNIVGVPYDFRKAPNELGQFFADLKELIEKTYYNNANEQSVLVCHSLGCPTILHFLHNQTQEWKNKFIKSLVSVAGAYGGAGVAISALASGDTLGVPTIKAIWVRRAQRSWPSTAYLLPKAAAWSQDEVLAITDHANYTLSNLKAFFKDILYASGYTLVKSVTNLTDVTKGPGVPVYCIMTKSTPTGKVYDWRGKKFPDEVPEIITGDGDGTVNWQSLVLCSKFADSQSQPVKTTHIEGVDHTGILRDDRFPNIIMNSVL